MNRAVWRLAKVGDAAAYINGLAFKPTDWGEAGRPIIRIQNLTDPLRPFNRTPREVAPQFIVRHGDILVSWSATLDAFVWRGPEAVLNQHIFKVVPNRSVVAERFLYYQLKHVIDEMWHSEHTHGSTMRHINRGPFLAHPFWLPPLEVQAILAQFLDAQFSRIDAIVASLARAKANVANARASVLKAAVEGRLVRSLAASATDTIARVRPHTGKRAAGMPPGWKVMSVASLADGPPSNGRSVPTRDGGFPVLRLTAMRGGRLDLSESKGGAWSRPEAEPWIVKAGDFLIMRGNGSLDRVGIAAIATVVTTDVAFPDTMIRLRTRRDIVDPRYLLLAWNSPLLRRQIEASARTTAGIHKINQTSLLGYSIPVPPLHEQAVIIAEVDRRLSVLDDIERATDANLVRCESVRQAVLKWAFEGRPVGPATLPAVSVRHKSGSMEPTR